MAENTLYVFVCPLEGCDWRKTLAGEIRVPMVKWPWNLDRQITGAEDKILSGIRHAFHEHVADAHPDVRGNWDDQRAHDWTLRQQTAEG